MAGPLDTSFRRSVRGGVEQQEFSDLSSFLNSVVLSTSNDRWYFSLSSSGEFSVKDTRLAIDDLVLPSHSEPTRWVKLIPIKINVFMWRARRGCLPTRYNLVQKGVILESTSCPFEYALNFSKSSIHPDSAPRNDAHGFLMPDANLANSRLYKDLQHHAHKSQTLRVPEPQPTFEVTKSQHKKDPKVLTFEETKQSSSFSLGQRGDPSLHYKFTFSTNTFMQEPETHTDDDVGIQFLGSITVDEVMKDAFSDPEAMPDDEIMSMFEGEDKSEKVLSPQDEVMADKVIDELVELTHTSSIAISTNLVSTITVVNVPLFSDPQLVHMPRMQDV
ncbi:hypothetical protein Tco_0918866 [Tanacetum coccineum]